MSTDKATRREGIQVHLKPGQRGSRGHSVGEPIPEWDDSVCEEVVPNGSCPTVFVAIPSAETLSFEIVSSS